MAKSFRRLLSLAIAATTAVIAAGCESSHISMLPMPASNAPMDATSQTFSSLASQVSNIGETQFSSIYAGVVIDNVKHVIVVYRKPTRSFDSDLRNNFPTAPIEFRDARLSYAEMTSLDQSILADGIYWAEHGAPLQSVGPQSDGSGVIVGVPNPTADLTKAFDARYVTGSITLQRIAVLPVPVSATPTTSMP